MATFTFDNMGSNGGGAGNTWNYSNEDNADFSKQLDGIIVEMKQVQETQYQTNAPLFWKNENGRASKTTEDTGAPCLNFCFVIDSVQFGEKEWIFNPKAKKDPKKNPDGLSAASMAIQQGMLDAGMQADNLDQLGGMNITVWTWEPSDVNMGGNWGSGNPRPFGFKVNNQGDKSRFRGCFPFGSKPQPQQAARQPMAQPSPSRLQNAMEQAGQAVRQANMRQQGAFPQPGMAQAYQPEVVPYSDEDIPF